MLKNILLITSLATLITSCNVFRPASSPRSASNPIENDDSISNAGASPHFISNISINTANGSSQTNSGLDKPAIGSNGSVSGAAESGRKIEDFSSLRFKYAILENAAVEELNNLKLLSFMDYWYGTPYHYGGTSRDGIDCSAFAFLLISSVYGINSLPRTSKDQYHATRRIPRGDLQEGDLVFFHTLGKRRSVTHVGVYLRNGRFIHASLSGVVISDMSEGYYDKHFVGAGRMPDPSPDTSGPSAVGSN